MSDASSAGGPIELGQRETRGHGLRCGDMSGQDPRTQLLAAVHWVLDYLETVRTLPVLARVRPGEVEAALPGHPPAAPEPMGRILEDIDRIVVPAVTHWNHPRFFGYFAITGSAPGIAGELVAAALNVNAMLWRTSPAATELEAVATGWLARMLGLPDRFGTINDTASSSTLYALAAARHACAPETRTGGLERGRMAVYASQEAHSSVDKAVATLGIGLDYLRKVPTDSQFRMDPAALEGSIERDEALGIRPMAVVATVGTTSTTSVDPLPAIADVCERHGAWLHADAAYAGIAGVVPELRWVLEGAGRTDSLVVNPHKWLFVPIDCSVLYLRDPQVTREAFSVVPVYLETTEEARNLMDYGIALGRRFRALKLWMVMRSMGTDGIAAAIREHVRLAGLLAGWIEQSPEFRLLAPAPLSVVNFRFAPPGAAEQELDRLNAALVEAINESGEAFVTSTRIRGRLAVHVAVGNLGTTEDDVRALWDLVRKLASGLPGG